MNYNNEIGRESHAVLPFRCSHFLAIMRLSDRIGAGDSAKVPALRHQLARPGARGPRAPSWDITMYLFSTKIKGTVFCPIATFVAKVR